MKLSIFLFFLVAGACSATPRFRRDAAADKVATIQEQHLDIDPSGHFRYNYQTSNGIAAQAEGTPKEIPGNPPELAENIQGTYSWTSPEGKTVNVQFIADENGYHPKLQIQ